MMTLSIAGLAIFTLASPMTALATAPSATTGIKDLPVNTQVILNDAFTVPVAGNRDYIHMFYYQNKVQVQYAAMSKSTPYCAVMIRPSRTVARYIPAHSSFTLTKPTDSSVSSRFHVKEDVAGVACYLFGHPITSTDLKAAFGASVTLSVP